MVDIIFIFLLILIPISIKLNQYKIKYELFYSKALTLLIITIVIFSLRNIERIYSEYKNYNFNPFISLNYNFFGGDEEFHYRYNSHLKYRYDKYYGVEILGKKFIYLSRNNY